MQRRFAIVVLTLALIAGGAYWYNSGPTAAVSFGSAQAQTAAADVVVEEMTMGDPNAPVTVVEYASFTCPHCANFHASTLKDIKKNYIDTGKVHFVFREAYFDRYGLWASMVARCGGQMRYFGIADMIFEGQREWIGDGQDAGTVIANLRRIGKIAGITDAELDVCLNDADQAQALVGWYQENFERDNMDATPSFLINGEKYSNMSYADFSAILDEKLAE